MSTSGPRLQGSARSRSVLCCGLFVVHTDGALGWYQGDGRSVVTSEVWSPAQLWAGQPHATWLPLGAPAIFGVSIRPSHHLCLHPPRGPHHSQDIARGLQGSAVWPRSL